MLDLKSFRESPTKMRAFVLIIAGLVIVLSLKWPSLATTSATVLLLYITFEYVLANQENVRLTRQQMERQQRVYVEFGLRDADEKVWAWAANLGLSTFLIVSIRVRTQDNPTPVAGKLNWILPIGELKNQITLDSSLYDVYPRPNYLRLDVSLSCRGIAGDHETPWRAFTIHHSGPHSIVYRGFRGVWAVHCPHCRKCDGMAMNLDGLNNLDEAWSRQKKLEQDLHKSCPNHQSELLLKSDPRAQSG